MDERGVAAAEEDRAWAAFNVPLPPSELIAFCQDVERLLRINPYLEFKQWQPLGEGRFHFQGRNLSREPALEIDLELSAEAQPDGIIIHYHDGLKASTRFAVEASSIGSKMTIVEDYSRHDPQTREARLHEVDQSLVKWAEDLQAWLVRWKRWSGFPPWRWYMRRMWLPMKPSARRITYILLWISLAEVALIGLGVVIYLLEYR
jgi:hypothetical protein